MIRAKFKVTQTNRGPSWQGGASLTVHMSPVYSQDPGHENKKFWDATPSGKIEMTVADERVFEMFKLGHEYYVDFTEES